MEHSVQCHLQILEKLVDYIFYSYPGETGSLSTSKYALWAQKHASVQGILVIFMVYITE